MSLTLPTALSEQLCDVDERERKIAGRGPPSMCPPEGCPLPIALPAALEAVGDKEKRKRHERQDEGRGEEHRHISVLDSPEDVRPIDQDQLEDHLLFGKREPLEKQEPSAAA